LKERLHAILLCFDGLSAPQIAAILYRDVETVRYWIKSFNKKGFFGLKSKIIPGRPSKMDDAKRDLLKKI
jgi:transposase